MVSASTATVANRYFMAHFQTPWIDLRASIWNRRMIPTVAMRDFMAAYNFGGQSTAADKLIGRK
jgi:hypothetical protein